MQLLILGSVLHAPHFLTLRNPPSLGRGSIEVQSSKCFLEDGPLPAPLTARTATMAVQARRATAMKAASPRSQRLSDGNARRSKLVTSVILPFIVADDEIRALAAE
jgi:hypothetical protein